MAIVTQPFKTLRRRLSVGAPVVPSDDLEPYTFNDLLKRGFIQEPKAQPVSASAPRKPAGRPKP